MANESDHCLIVGLGNPGKEYAFTRHNAGFLGVQVLAARLGWVFKKEMRFKGYLAQGVFEERPLSLLLPFTYMNLSGEAVRQVVDYFQIHYGQERNFLVVVDDVYIPFGELRLRSQGSSGGHNGLKSIEHCLQTQEFPRLRLGVGPLTEGLSAEWRSRGLKDYVLGPFSGQEKEQLPLVLTECAQVIECWLRDGVEAAQRKAGELRKSSAELQALPKTPQEKAARKREET